MFRQYKNIAKIYRQSYTDKKSSYKNTGRSCIGYLHPMSTDKNQITPDKFGKEFAFTASVKEDLREADKLVIDGVSYRIKGVANYTGIVIKYKRAHIVKEDIGS